MYISDEAMKVLLSRAYEQGYSIGYDIGRGGKLSELEKPKEVTYRDIFTEFVDNYPDFAYEVVDWRPYFPPYTRTGRPMNIVIWLKNGETKRYCYETKKLYPEGSYKDEVEEEQEL